LEPAVVETMLAALATSLWEYLTPRYLMPGNFAMHP
jgi:hypothetical protein